MPDPFCVLDVQENFRHTYYDVGIKRYFDPYGTRIASHFMLSAIKTPQIRSFFYEKWLLFGVLRVNKPCLFMQA